MERTKKYKKSEDEERFLNELNRSLVQLERELIADFIEPAYPTVFIVGPQRSGTTLLMQMMLRYFSVGYVSNLVARFWMAPYVGLLINRPYFRNAQFDPELASDLGYTQGHDGPHEFGYFWGRWFGHGKTHCLDESELESIDSALLSKELAAMESVHDLPFVFKNLIYCSLNIPFLSDILPKSIFLTCVRDPLFVAQSTLESRERLYGTRRAWIGLRPSEVEDLEPYDPVRQVAGQVVLAQKRIREDLSALSGNRWIEVSYKELCEAPEACLERIKRKVSALGGPLGRTGAGIGPVRHTDHLRLSKEDVALLKRCIREYEEAPIRRFRQGRLPGSQ